METHYDYIVFKITPYDDAHPLSAGGVTSPTTPPAPLQVSLLLPLSSPWIYYQVKELALSP